MKPSGRLRSFLALAGSTLLAISYSHAADGTWTQTLAGPFDWDDIANWSSGAGPIADGADFTAFYTANIAADQTVNVNNAKTIGNITFTDSTTSSHNLTISGANILSLDRTDATKPTINVTQAGRLLTISSVIAGNDGLLKSGPGTLVFTSTSNNTFSGGFDISGGRVQYDTATNANAWGDAGNVITFTGNAELFNNNNAYTLARAITVNGGVTATLGGSFGESTNITGAVTGSGDVNIAGGSNGWAVTMSNAANNLTGTVWVTSNAGNNTSLTVNSFADGADATKRLKMGATTATADFTLQGISVTPIVFTNRAVELAGTTGAISINNNSSDAARTLTISRDLLFTAASSGNKTLTLGGSNTGSNTFGGIIGNNGSSTTGITKSGNGRWVLSNTANSYTGGTTVTAGTLETGASNVLGAGPVTVTGGTLQLGAFDHTMGVVTITGGTIGGSGILTANRLIVSGGTIAPVVAGSASLYKLGTGSITLSQTNTFSGGITVQSGTLAVGASGTLGANSSGNSIIIQDSGILTLAAAANSGSNQGITLSSSLNTGAPVLSGGAGPVGRLAVLGLGFNGLPNGTISQANTLGGVIAINAVTGYNTDLSPVLTGKNLFLGAIGTSTFTGAAGTVVAGNDSLYRLGGGGGQITFNTTNLFTGGNGLQVGSTFANGGGTVVISAAQDYTGATTVNAGTLTLNGANGTATGSSGFTLNGGRLFLDSSGVVGNNNANRIGNVSVSLRNGGELSLNGNAAGTTEAFGDLNLGAGYSTVTATATTTASTLAGVGFSRTNNGTALFRGTALGTNVAAMGQVTLSNTTGLSFVGDSFLNNAASGDTTKDVAIVPYLIGGTTGTDTGSTFVTYDGTLGFRALNTTNHFNTTVTAGTNVRLAAAQTGIATDSINSLIHTTGSSTIADGATLTVTSGAILFTGGNINQAGTTGILDFGANTGFWTTTGNASIGARIIGSGGLVKSGTAQLTLANTNNSYTGGTVLNGGTLATSADGNLGTGGGITVNANAGWSMGPAVAVSYARGLTINEGASLTLTSGNAGKTVTGVLSGNGTLFANHSTDFIFSNAANTFTGEIVSQTANSLGYGLGFASIGDTAGAGLINLVGNTGTFRWLSASGSTTTLANRQFSISTPGQATISGFGTTAASNLVIEKDLLITGEAGARSLRLAGANTGNNTFAGKITDEGTSVVSLVKDQSGRWILTGANTYTGATTVSDGTLVGIGANAFGSTAGISSNNAPTISLRGDTSTSFVKASDSTPYTLTTSATGVTLNVDQATISGTGAKTMSFGDITTTSTAATYQFNFTGDNNTSLSAGTLSTSVSTGTALHTINNTISGGGSLTLASVFNRATTVVSPDLIFTGAGTSIVTGGITQTQTGMDLIKNGAGTLLLNGTNTYTGLTTVTAGTLGGTGTIAGSVTVETNGSLAPGASTLPSAGTLNIGGGLTVTAMATGTAGKLKFELGANTAASDQLAVTGGLAIGSGVLGFSDFTFTNLPGGPQNGTYVLITSSGITGTLDPDLVDRKGTIGVGGEGELSISGDNIVLTVTGLGGGTPYQNWATGGELFNDDANNDGVSNGVAFLLGASGPNVNALGKLPTITEAAGGLVLTFDMLDSASRGTATLSVEHSSDLGIIDLWEAALVPDADNTVNDVVFNIEGSGTLDVVATIPFGKAAGGRLFGRLKATE